MINHGLRPITNSGPMWPVNKKSKVVTTSNWTEPNTWIHQHDQSPSAPFCHFSALPHPTHTVANILPPRAVSVKYLKNKTCLFTPSVIHAGNSSISYKYQDGFLAFGSINSIWEIVLHRVLRTFVIVAPRQHLSPEDQSQNPYQRFPGFQCTVVYIKHLETYTVIEPVDIISHLVYYDRWYVQYLSANYCCDRKLVP